MKPVDMVSYMNEYYEPVLQMEQFSNWKAKVFRDCVVVTCPRSVIGLKKKKKQRHFLNQSDEKLKQISTESPAFSRASRLFHVFALSS